MVERRLNRLLPLFSQSRGFAHLPKLDFRHHTQDVFLALEVVEECPLAHVRCLGDVFYRDVRKAALGKQLEGATKEAQACLCSPALTAIHVGEVGKAFGEVWREGGSDFLTADHK